MAWFSLRRLAKPKRAQFEQADPVVVKVFADLQKVRYLNCNHAQRFERQAWDRLLDYLVKLPPLPADEPNQVSTTRRGS